MTDKFSVGHSQRTFVADSNVYRDNVKLANRPKYDYERFRFVISVYGSLLFSFALTMSMINYTRLVDDFAFFKKGIMTVINLITVGLLIGSMIYLHKYRFQRYEFVFNTVNKNKPTQIVYSLYAEAMNEYMKVGVIIFGLVSIIYSIIVPTVFSKQFRDCFDVVNLIYNIVQASLISIEMIFIIKYNRLIVLMRQQVAIFILAQVIFTNIMMWVEVTVIKLAKVYHIKHTETDCSSFITSISAYFLPCFAEFLVIAIVIFYEILCRVGRISLVMNNEHEKGDSVWHMLKTNFGGFCVSCFFTFSAIEIFIIIITMSSEIELENVLKIHLIEELFLYLMGITTNSILFLNTKKFKYSFTYHINNIDSNLLVICTFASLVYCVNTFIGSIYINIELQRSNRNVLDYVQSTILSYRSATSIVEGVNVVVQTYIIRDGFHRCNRGSIEDRKKLGRGSIIVLMGINASLWLLKSLQLKKGDIMFNYKSIKKILIDRENQLTNFFMFFLTPLTILYRYHCTVCLSTMLTRMYEDEGARFECQMRIEGILHHLNLHKHSVYDDPSDTLSCNTLSEPGRRHKQSSLLEIIGARKRVRQSIKTMEKNRSLLKNLM